MFVLPYSQENMSEDSVTRTRRDVSTLLLGPDDRGDLSVRGLASQNVSRIMHIFNEDRRMLWSRLRAKTFECCTYVNVKGMLRYRSRLAVDAFDQQSD